MKTNKGIEALSDELLMNVSGGQAILVPSKLGYVRKSKVCVANEALSAAKKSVAFK